MCKEKCDYLGLPYFEGFSNLVSRILQNSILGFILTLIKQFRCKSNSKRKLDSKPYSTFSTYF